MGGRVHKVTIVGGGLIGSLEAYCAYLVAKLNAETLRVTIDEKNSDISQTTTSNIFPSLTPDEILSVVPRGRELILKLQALFSEPGGIRVDDVAGINGTGVAQKFINAVQEYGLDAEGHELRTKALLQLGKLSMQFWRAMYDNGDEDFKLIMRESNFQPGRELSKSEIVLHDGYRIDLIFDVQDAVNRAQSMQQDYAALGYKNCRILTPSEASALDPSLSNFCVAQSEVTPEGTRVWKNSASALYRPGGCIDTSVFLPKLHAYLEQKMGTYVNDAGVTKSNFRVKYKRKVDAIHYAEDDPAQIDGLHFENGHSTKTKPKYATSNYVFCPGEAVGTLNKLGFTEPAYAGFAGPSLRLTIPVPDSMRCELQNFNHCMEVHQDGLVLVWQARYVDGNIVIGVAGTKAFYSDRTPTIDQEFAKNRHLLQLNIINTVLPQLISLALSRNTFGQQLTSSDLQTLRDNAIAKPWVGVRAVAYDGFPTLGNVYRKEETNLKVTNARTTTGLGSGGVSFGPAAVVFSRAAAGIDDSKLVVVNPEFVKTIAKFSTSDRGITK